MISGAFPLGTQLSVGIKSERGRFNERILCL